jgi:hypothetical protein
MLANDGAIRCRERLCGMLNYYHHAGQRDRGFPASCPIPENPNTPAKTITIARTCPFRLLHTFHLLRPARNYPRIRI